MMMMTERALPGRETSTFSPLKKIFCYGDDNDDDDNDDDTRVARHPLFLPVNVEDDVNDEDNVVDDDDDDDDGDD